MGKCFLCGRNCGVDREISVGKCGVSSKMKIARIAPHHFEEPPISGTRGSGTIFFCGCSLSCVFCQNYSVSRNLVGKEISERKLADEMKKLVELGVHNINFVSPTQYADKIVRALDIYRPKIPILYNSHGYDNVQTIERLRGYVDIYLPDLKYFNSVLSKRYSGIEDYFEVAAKAIMAMRSQVSDSFDEDGMMKRGVIVRHLILPRAYSDSLKLLTFLSENLKGTLVSIMSQFTPYGNLEEYKEIDRKLFSAEIEKVQNFARELGIEGFFQKREASDEKYIPEWNY